MEEKKQYMMFNAFLVKDEYASLDYSVLLKSSSQINTYDLDPKHEVNGKLFVKIPEEKKPLWSIFTENITGSSIVELSNRSSSATLIIKTDKATIAFTFGYGRFLLDMSFFVHDFGIKTALNTLDHSSLRSVDLVTLEEQSVQKKSQASRESSIGIFGIDISKDVLRAVTGSPKEDVDLKNISGGDSVFSFGTEINVSELPSLADKLYSHYNSEAYKDGFSWVDNIRKIREKSEIDRLDKILLASVQSKGTDFTISVPEIMQWDEVYGFSFTRSKSLISPKIERDDYLKNIDSTAISIEMIKRDRLFVFDVHENESDYSVYKCIYFEHKDAEKTNILFSGVWYEIDNVFISRIQAVLSRINVCKLIFPKVYIWKEIKDKKERNCIECEGDYNARIADGLSYYLLDKKLVKSSTTTTSIELCDLLTPKKQFIHVKHKKGGSAGLSHLFAQGHVSAEILLGDKRFRKEARKVLKKVSDGLQNIVPLDNFKSNGVEIVFLILGEDSVGLKDNLPFFSKVNLSKTYENLSQRGFDVTIAGADTVLKPKV
ncbi:TIGR04141 family sporadically distributed protein [Kosakonia cowanii]|uniref:TIGR04141 family sporadically distributed protein n=1 Tax=Kosakonia cowanii TaxID=208223 RepID=UPI00289619ED|nr:TIGR04141 family sporadically distributed protein [Kosakonia cowanii]MDT3413229.1 uncharacterized protein (TIGR04141 family) [Atlantibacter sp. SORGH_AS_0304]